MKPANDGPNVRLALKSDSTDEASSVLACLAEIEVLIKGTWAPNIRFDLHASPDLPIVTYSRADLQSSIMNLLFNARDAMPKGGVISLTAALFYEGQAAPNVELGVADNGVGMTRDTLLRATDPFFTTKTTGLGGHGLPMVMSFVHGAGGRLYIESQQGVGTTVTLRLPISESEA
ncbi:hypothetical protein GCM10007937_52360 [Mesorhizobium albiziae]|nr:hypothetical protein GCM10007937_52360 [Mesorhizobium albiziae]